MLQNMDTPGLKDHSLRWDWDRWVSEILPLQAPDSSLQAHDGYFEHSTSRQTEFTNLNPKPFAAHQQNIARLHSAHGIVPQDIQLPTVQAFVNVGLHLCRHDEFDVAGSDGPNRTSRDTWTSTTATIHTVCFNEYWRDPNYDWPG
jgi:hypothetical protein